MTQARHTYTVMGATGHIGSVVAECLLQTGNLDPTVKEAARTLEHFARDLLPYPPRSNS